MSNEQYSPSRFQLLPPVVKNLLIINGIFFFATYVFGDVLRWVDLTDKLGLHFFLAEKFNFIQIITYMFMHGGLTHIFFNMFALWMFGNTLENVWGPKRFLTYYLITGIGAVITHYTYYYFVDIRPVFETLDAFIANPDIQQISYVIDYMKSGIPLGSKEAQVMIDHYNEFIATYESYANSNNSQGIVTATVEYISVYKNDLMNLPVVVGASGAVFGILLAFGMLFPNTLLYIYFAIPIKAKYFVIIYGLIELFGGIINTPGDNVAHFAHLGGMLFGFILIYIWRKKRNQFY